MWWCKDNEQKKHTQLHLGILSNCRPCFLPCFPCYFSFPQGKNFTFTTFAIYHVPKRKWRQSRIFAFFHFLLFLCQFPLFIISIMHSSTKLITPRWALLSGRAFSPGVHQDTGFPRFIQSSGNYSTNPRSSTLKQLWHPKHAVIDTFIYPCFWRVTAEERGSLQACFFGFWLSNNSSIQTPVIMHNVQKRESDKLVFEHITWMENYDKPLITVWQLVRESRL